MKIFASILTSTLWALDDATRLVWITLLALADKDGFVRASPSGLSRLANVDEARGREAIANLSAPDKDSGSQEYEGRRIEAVEGGFVVLNYKKYRDLRDAETRREQVRDAVKRHRAKKSNVITGNPVKAHASAPTPVSEKAGTTTTLVEKPTKVTWLTPFAEAWQAKCGGKMPMGPASKYLRPLHDQYGADQVLTHWRHYLAATDCQYASPARFASTFGAWDGTTKATKPGRIDQGRENMAEWLSGKEAEATIDCGDEVLPGEF